MDRWPGGPQQRPASGVGCDYQSPSCGRRENGKPKDDTKYRRVLINQHTHFLLQKVKTFVTWNLNVHTFFTSFRYIKLQSTFHTEQSNGLDHSEPTWLDRCPPLCSLGPHPRGPPPLAPSRGAAAILDLIPGGGRDSAERPVPAHLCLSSFLPSALGVCHWPSCRKDEGEETMARIFLRMRLWREVWREGHLWWRPHLLWEWRPVSAKSGHQFSQVRVCSWKGWKCSEKLKLEGWDPAEL